MVFHQLLFLLDGYSTVLHFSALFLLRWCTRNVCVCMHVCLFNIKRSISRHRLSFPKDTFPPASRREEIFYIPAREEKQVMNRYNIPGMAFLKFVTPCKILLCVGTVYFVPPSAVVKLFLSSRCDLFFSAKKSPARGH